MNVNTRTLGLALCLSSFTASSLGCSDDGTPSSPIAPSLTSQPAQVPSSETFQAVPNKPRSTQQSVHIPDVGTFQAVTNNLMPGTGEVHLKATPAVPESPINNVVVVGQTPTLTATNARGSYQDITFHHVFELYNVSSGGMTPIQTATVIQGTNKTSYQITEQLDPSTSYKWRVRPELDGIIGPWSAYASFATSALTIVGVPTPTSPINGVTTTSLLPVFNVTNGSNLGDTGEVIYQIQLSTDDTFITIAQEVGTHARPRGDTNISLLVALEPSTEYFWRARGRNDGQGKTALLPGPSTVIVEPSPWSETVNFFTPEASAYSCCPPPNRLTVALEVGAEIGYPGSVDVNTFTQRVAERLHAEDSNWGRRINSTGPLGKDTVAYKASDGRPYSIDIVSGAGSSNPKIHWYPHGFIGGTWVAP